MLLLLMMVAGVTSTLAQNVTISPQNGSMICSDASGQGTSGGAFSMWRHEQLALTMIASGATTLSDDGILTQHRNWFNTCNGCTFRSNVTAAQKATFIDCGWQDANGYYTISLPKGYRFTGYRFELSHDITNTGQGQAFQRYYNPNTEVTWSETGRDFGTAINSVTLPAVPSQAAQVQVYKLERTGNDMGNILYFKATSNDDSGTDYYDLTFRHIELTFAADADSPIDIQPSTQVTSGHSLLQVPFNTGKVDIGQVTQRTIPNYGSRISYSLNNFKDMSANMLLYEYGSTQDGTGFDGTSGQVAYDKAGSIMTNGNYFRFAPSADVTEQKYVLETPVSAIQAGNIANPVQFRITGATIKYTNVAEETFHITAVIDGTTYYLGTNGRFTTDQQTVWMRDAAGHIFSGSSYLQGTDGDVSTGPVSGATVYSITDNGTIRYGTTNRYLKAHANYTYNWGWQFSHYSGRITNSSDDTTASIDEIIAAGASNATIYVYDKEGGNRKEITVNGTGSEPITGLNNDAIIFGVKGGDVALLNFEVELQALNPFIDQMTVVLNVKKDDNTDVRMTRSFTSDDFSVGGDTFEFYLPTELEGKPVDITFEDLYSKYGDETYDHISGTDHSSSRYNYVMSQHHQAYTNDNIYNNTAEAKSSTLESARLTNNSMIRTKVGTVGDQPFIFNNADELSTNAGYLREFPFTVNNYAHQSTNPNLTVKPEDGEFIAAHFTAQQVNTSGHTKDFYVFTTDETRYNIAPTTATQHRAYAYYKMVVLVQVGTYDPIATFEPVYTDAFYQDADGNNTTGDFFGVKITAPSNIDTPLASDVAINKAIVSKIKENNSSATDEEVAAEMKKILYLDASPLSGVYHTTPSTGDEAYAVASFNALKEKFDANALVFLPANATDKYNNFAYAQKGEVQSFKSANNIILTDKHPFYSPYDIQVDAANYAVYTRQTTKSTYSGEEYATVIMPFTIKFDTGSEKGVKTDADYGKLKFLQMNTTNATSDNAYNYGPAFFFSPAQGTQVEANTPYALHVEENKASDCFTLRQYGSNIIATPAAAKSVNSLFSATVITSTGNLTGKDNVKHTYTFSHKGSFSGHKVPRDPVTFYFANNGFYSSADLKSTYTTVDLFPFRSVYEVISGGNAKVGFMHIFEGENNTTGIVDINKDNNYSGIATGEGTITITADTAGTYRIFSAAGQNASNVTLRAGETKTVNVPAGVYVVNGVKVLVK